jgi:hypothetical protein
LPRVGRVAFAGVAFPFAGPPDGSFEVGSALGAGARGGVSLYLEAFAVARTASGLIRLAAPSSFPDGATRGEADRSE